MKYHCALSVSAFLWERCTHKDFPFYLQIAYQDLKYGSMQNKSKIFIQILFVSFLTRLHHVHQIQEYQSFITKYTSVQKRNMQNK